METVDLSGLDVRARAQEGVDMPMLDHHGNATPVVLRVRGFDSVSYNDTSKAHVRKQIERGRKASEAERNAEFWDLQATLLCGWFVAGKPVALKFAKDGPSYEYSPASAAKLLEEQQWIFEQVIRHAERRANFLPGSASA